LPRRLDPGISQRNADICCTKRRRVIDPIPDHRHHFSGALQYSHQLQFLTGCDTRVHPRRTAATGQQIPVLVDGIRLDDFIRPFS